LICILGEIIKQGDIKCILNEGMPFYRKRPENLAKLEKVLPPRTPVQIPMDAEECVLVEYDPRAHGGPTQVNCATY
jgi:hypothetical protein